MKWFQHDISMHADPRMELLVAKHGPAGKGVYWDFVERIGFSSGTFRVKINGISRKADREYSALDVKDSSAGKWAQGCTGQLERIPEFQIALLAGALHTRVRKLRKIIETSVRSGLFERDEWVRYRILRCPGLELAADSYTRRCRRERKGDQADTPEVAHNVRTLSEECAHKVGDVSEKVLLELEG